MNMIRKTKYDTLIEKFDIISDQLNRIIKLMTHHVEKDMSIDEVMAKLEKQKVGALRG